MYFTNIGNKELIPFHNSESVDISLSLTEILNSELFEVETIIENSLYRVFPLFYSNQIVSSNNNDKILSNRCLILQKQEHETYLSFRSDEHENNVIFYDEIIKTCDIGDKLSVDEFNGLIYRLRKNKQFHEVLNFAEENRYIDDDINVSLNINPDYDNNKLKTISMKGVAVNSIDNSPVANKTFHMYRLNGNGEWVFINSVNTNGKGEYSYIDYGINSYFDNSPVGSRDELQTLINTAIENNETKITLNKQYKFNNGDSYITIPETITIHGNGHIIDANVKSRIFNVSGDNVVIDNVVLLNGNINSEGGGVYWSGDDGLLSNSIIADCISDNNGGAICWKGARGNIRNLKTINNATNAKGGGLYVESESFQMYNLISFNNYSNDAGACLYLIGSNCIIDTTMIRKDTSNGLNPSIMKFIGNNNSITNTNVDTVYFNQNRVDRTTRDFNDCFWYKLVPSTWIDERDDYSVFNDYNHVLKRVKSNNGDMVDVMTFKGKYANYKVYNLNNQLKNNEGVIINDKIKNNPLKIKLLNSYFKHANYNLTGHVSSINDVNVSDIVNNNILVEDVNILLNNNSLVEIPLSDFENDSILDNSVDVDIDFNVPEIRYSPTIKLSVSSESINVGESVVLTAVYKDEEQNPVYNATITFKDGNTVISTVNTNVDGVASFNYTPGVDGLHSLTAESLTGVVSNVASVNVVSFDAITLTSDKTILSYSDDESATLTAQLMNSGSISGIEGVSVDFNIYDENNVLLDTLTASTDGTGLATVSYHSQATGNIYIKATTSNIFSNNIQIEDLEYYNPNTYSTSNLEIDLSNEFTLPQNFEMKFTVIYYGEKKNTGIYFGSSINNRCNIGINGSPNDNGITFYTGSWEIHNSQLKLPTNIEVEIKYTYINGVHSYYVNNDLKVQFTKIWEYRNFIYLIVQTYLKDLKIKKL